MLKDLKYYMMRLRDKLGLGGYDRVDGMVIRYPALPEYYMIYGEIIKDHVYDIGIEAPRLIVDAGSNIGLYTLYACSLYPGVRVLCFEPDTYAYSYLLKNLSLNGLSNVKPYNVALCDGEGDVLFHYDTRVRNNMSMGLYENSATDATTIVKAARLSKYLEEPVDILKLDVECAEYGILKDLEAHDKFKLVSNIVLEYHGFHRDVNPLEEVLELLIRNGYSLRFKVLQDKYDQLTLHATRRK